MRIKGGKCVQTDCIRVLYLEANASFAQPLSLRTVLKTCQARGMMSDTMKREQKKRDQEQLEFWLKVLQVFRGDVP